MQTSDFQRISSGSDSKIWKIQIIPNQVLKVLKIRTELWKRIANCGIQMALSKAFRAHEIRTHESIDSNGSYGMSYV